VVAGDHYFTQKKYKTPSPPHWLSSSVPHSQAPVWRCSVQRLPARETPWDPRPKIQNMGGFEFRRVGMGDGGALLNLTQR